MPKETGRIFRLLSIVFFLLISLCFSNQKTVIVIIDGARYSETLGDPTHQYTPNMWQLAQQYTYVETFYNDSITYTSRAIPALWCGSWTEVRDTTVNGQNTQYTIKPTIFEYFRKHRNQPAEQCFYVLKYISSLWLPSFHPEFGPTYWPEFHSQGTSDTEVATQAQWVMATYHPDLLWIYLADVDHYGHTGNWQQYTRAIQRADSIVNVIWSAIQSSPFYQNQTTLFVTNDHGRHDDAHGGFQGHGDGCPGCRHIMFLAAGVGIKQQFVSNQYRRIPDLAVTVGHLMNFNTDYATGEVMVEIFSPTRIASQSSKMRETLQVSPPSPNPFNTSTGFFVELPQPANVEFRVFNLLGEQIGQTIEKRLVSGRHPFHWEAPEVPSGIYFFQITTGRETVIQKALLIR